MGLFIYYHVSHVEVAVTYSLTKGRYRSVMAAKKCIITQYPVVVPLAMFVESYVINSRELYIYGPFFVFSILLKAGSFQGFRIFAQLLSTNRSQK